MKNTITLLMLGIFFISVISANTIYSGGLVINLTTISSSLSFSESINYTQFNSSLTNITFSNVICLDDGYTISQIFFNESNTHRDIGYYCNPAAVVVDSGSSGDTGAFCCNLKNDTSNLTISLNNSGTQENLTAVDPLGDEEKKYKSSDIYLFIGIFIIIIVIIVLSVLSVVLKKK